MPGLKQGCTAICDRSPGSVTFQVALPLVRVMVWAKRIAAITGKSATSTNLPGVIIALPLQEQELLPARDHHPLHHTLVLMEDTPLQARQSDTPRTTFALRIFTCFTLATSHRTFRSDLAASALADAVFYSFLGAI